MKNKMIYHKFNANKIILIYNKILKNNLMKIKMTI